MSAALPDGKRHGPVRINYMSGKRAVEGSYQPSGEFVRTNPDGTTTSFTPDPARYDPTPIDE